VAAQLVASRVVLSSTELVMLYIADTHNLYIKFQITDNTLDNVRNCVNYRSISVFNALRYRFKGRALKLCSISSCRIEMLLLQGSLFKGGLE
jgi:hypothetical protein